jgi:hypothetical protein
MLEAIAEQDACLLRACGDRSVAAQPQRLALTFLCFEHYMRICALPLIDAKAGVLVDWLEFFRQYTQCMRAMILHPSLCDVADMGRLFGFRAVSETSFRVLRDGRVHDLVTANKIPSQRTPDGAKVVIKAHLATGLAESVKKQLRDCVADVLDAYSDLDIICTVQGKSRKEQRARLRIIFQLILVVDSLRGLEPTFKYGERTRYVAFECTSSCSDLSTEIGCG